MPYLDQQLIERVTRRAKALDIHGRQSGWITVNGPRVALGYATKPINLMGWFAVAHWAKRKASECCDPGRVEVREGKRIGIPTIDVGRSLTNLALALVAPGPVYARLGDAAIQLDY